MTADNRLTQRVLVEAPAEIVSEIRINAVALRERIKTTHATLQFSPGTAQEVVEAVYAYAMLYRMGWLRR